MKKKLIRRNKARLSKRLKLLRSRKQQKAFDLSQITYDSIRRSKQRGQQYYQQRMGRQQKMNPRQLKKFRKRQIRLGLVGSKYGGICKVELKPAAASKFKND